MPKATEHTTTTRRTALVLGGAFGAIGITAGMAASVADVTPGADAELIALFERAVSASARREALCAPVYSVLRGEDAEMDAAMKRAQVASGEIADSDYHPAVEAAAELQATSWAGMRAKARLAIVHLDDDDPLSAIGASLARDVLAWRA